MVPKIIFYSSIRTFLNLILGKNMKDNHEINLENKRWLNPKELEELYGFSRSWQSKARMQSSNSSLPFAKVGSYIRYDSLQISAWLESHAIRG